jgi:hypothetical protein
MRYHAFSVASSFVLASLTISSTADAATPWRSENYSALAGETTRSAALRWEIGYLALSAIDAGETISCLNRGICEEGNPIFGKHPSAKKLIAAKVGLGAAHFFAFTRLNERNPRAALRLAQVSTAVQGGVVMLNARFSFN